MNLKVVAVISALAVSPSFAQGQMKGPPPPSGPPPTQADVQKVVKLIGGDKAKLQDYCDLGKLNDQMMAADQKKDTKTLQALAPKADALAQKLGPDYMKLMDGLGQVDENSALGKAVSAAFETLDKQCK
jgi:hypothetical protein